MIISTIFHRALEKLATPNWPYRWLALESPAVAEAYKNLQRSFWLIGFPLLGGFTALLLLCKLAGFSESTVNLRVSLGLIGAAIVFFLVPAIFGARFSRTLIAHWRSSGNTTSRRLKFYTIALVISVSLQVLGTVLLIGLAVFVLVYGAHVV